MSKKILQRDRFKYDAILDALLGMLFGVILIHYNTTVITLLQHLWDVIHGRLLRDNVGWLETFPAGFKLNVPLTKVLGRGILLVTLNHENMLKVLISITSKISTIEYIIQGLGMSSFIFGFKFLCAFLFDISRVTTIHIYLMSMGFQKIYFCLSNLFSSLWRLFRGKKKNVLRHRSDTLEFDFMQLLLGMILFTICLFLFTTIVVYYAFFTCVHLAVIFCVMFVWGAYFLVDRFGLGLCDIVTATLSPGRFRTKVHFDNNYCCSWDHHTKKVVVINIQGRNVDIICVKRLSASNLNSLGIISQILVDALRQGFKRVPVHIKEIMTGESCTITNKCLEATK